MQLLPPWKHQDEAREWARKKRWTLLAMEMGTGKSRVVVDLIGEAQHAGLFLIFCPRTVRDAVWPSEFAKWYQGPHHPVEVLALARGTSTRKANELRMFARGSGHRVIVVNYETAFQPAMAEAIAEFDWKVMVTDESHRIKNPTGRTTKVLTKLAANATWRVCLTGTPMPHSPLDIFAQARWLNHRYFGTYWTRFKQRYATFGVAPPEGIPDEWKVKLETLDMMRMAHASELLRASSFKSAFREDMATKIRLWLAGKGRALTDKEWGCFKPLDHRRMQQVTGYKNEEELQERIARFTYVARAADVLTLPEQHHVERQVELEPRAMRLYQELERHFVADIEGGEISVKGVLDKLLRLAQITGGAVPDDNGDIRIVSTAKRDSVQEWMEDLPPSEPLVVFARFRHDLDMIHDAAEGAGRRSFELSGRRKELNEWNEAIGGEVLAVQTQAGGVGISLVRSRLCYYYTPTWSLGDHDQSLARVHRPGQEREVFYFYSVARGTIEERIYRALRERKDVVQEVIEGVRELQRG